MGAKHELNESRQEILVKVRYHGNSMKETWGFIFRCVYYREIRRVSLSVHRGNEAYVMGMTCQEIN